MKPFFITLPHSGETVPPEAPWLRTLPMVTLFRDVDRFVDKLYGPAMAALDIAFLKADIHRYVVDLNRMPQDIDQDSVEGAPSPKGTFHLGFHWVRTTTGETLLPHPLSMAQHDLLTRLYYVPFHRRIENQLLSMREKGHAVTYHLDAHSMPSQGTAAHRDGGHDRPEIVVSDKDGTSCSKMFSDLVQRAYQKAGFQVAYNWPYKGGRITEVYGKPAQGQHTLQVELNRKLYMDETTKQWLPDLATNVQKQLEVALQEIVAGL